MFREKQLTFEGSGRVEILRSLIVDLQRGSPDERRGGLGVVLGDVDVDHRR